MLSILKVLGMILIVSILKLSVTFSVFSRRLDAEGAKTGICALLLRDNSTGRIINNIGRKPLKSSEFIHKIVKFVLFIALKLHTKAYSRKKRI
jgi:hypothetical protein